MLRLFTVAVSVVLVAACGSGSSASGTDIVATTGSAAPTTGSAAPTTGSAAIVTATGSAAPTTGSAAPTTPTSDAHRDDTSCPPRPEQPLPSHAVPGTDTTLVPGHPVSVLACRYHGPPSGSLASSATFAPAALAAALDDVEVLPKGTEYPCPIDFGEVILLRFGYDSGRGLDVDLHPWGCRYATNGELKVLTPEPLLSELQERLGVDGPCLSPSDAWCASTPVTVEHTGELVQGVAGTAP
jgi:hypothetical protein